jgi:hypothetical protein
LPDHIQSEEKIMKLLTPAIIALVLLTGCSPEVGSKAWCENMENKAKGDWTASEAADYAKNCLLK